MSASWKSLLVGVALASATPAYAATTIQAPLLPFYTTYGDANVYSLPTLQYIYCRQNGGAADKLSCGGKNPYDVQSSAGQIKDLVVIATDASGKDLTQNFAGMNDAYPTPSGTSGSVYFSTGSVTDPGSSFGAPANDLSFTWDASLASLQTFLSGAGGGELLFFFNNNQEGTGAEEQLAAWGRVWITDASGNQVGEQFYLTNQGAPYGAGGTDFGDPGAFTGANNLTPLVGDASATDYVLAGSAFCVDTTTFLVTACGGPNASPPLAHNLGDDEAAYAVQFPELNALLSSLFGSVANLSQYTLHVETRLGCEASTGSDAAADPAAGHCEARSLNSGGEQIFIGTGFNTTQVPEPGSLALLGIALLGIAGLRRRLRKSH